MNAARALALPIARFGVLSQRAGRVLRGGVAGLRGLSAAAFGAQFSRLVVGALPITALATALAGAVTAMQAASQLARLGAPHLVADVSALGFARELGPLLAGLLLAAKGGAGVASEVGLMVYDGQVQAMRALGLRPDRELVAPRLLALTLGGVWLSAAAIFAGWVGAMAVCAVQLQMAPEHFWYRVLWAVAPLDLVGGLFKGGVFGGLVALSGLTFALADKRGAGDVGRHTMQAVVAASAAVLLSDPIVTALLRVVES